MLLIKFFLFLPLLSSLSFSHKFYSFTINYGSGTGELGIIFEPETPPIGPFAFSTDNEGNIYISDPVNSSIKIFSFKEGKISGAIPFKGLYDDLMVSPLDEIYILKRDSSEILKIEKNGKISSLNFDGISKIPSKLFLWKGKVFIRKEGEISYLTKKDLEELSYFYSVEYLRKGEGKLKKIDSSGKIISEKFIKRDNLVSLEFLNEDREGNIYIQVEYLIDETKVGLEVLKLNPSGDLIDVVPIPENDYFIWTSRLLFVDDRGWIYQVLPKRDFVKINIWGY
jgi:hypothetical protein